MRRLVGLGLAPCALGALSPTALAREPRLAVGPSKLRSSLFCQESVTNAARTPVLLVTGTGVDGSEAWPDGLQVSLIRAGVPSCYVNFPQRTTGDIQVAVQYLVHAVRVVRRRAGRDIAVYGISQGGLLPRLALRYWPSLRAKVSDAVLLAGTQHGTTVLRPLLAACAANCRLPAAAWQQTAGSNLLRALNRRGRDETPGPTSWTTVRTLFDEIVQPTGGPHPTSALEGASNLVIQRICPGRATNHIGTGVDSVSYAALRDAMTHPGPARAARINRSVCRRPYAPGLDPGRTSARIADTYARAAPRTLQGAEDGILLSREPVVRRWVRAR
jgi:hypothetical protein